MIKKLFNLKLAVMLILAGTLSLNAQVNLTNGLVANYPFTGNANDVSGNNLNGTILGTVTSQPDRFGTSGSSYKFGGTSSDVINVKNTSNQLNLNHFLLLFGSNVPELTLKK